MLTENKIKEIRALYDVKLNTNIYIKTKNGVRSMSTEEEYLKFINSKNNDNTSKYFSICLDSFGCLGFEYLCKYLKDEPYIAIVFTETDYMITDVIDMNKKKETKHIYSITNRHSKNTYIGQTNNFSRRQQQHINMLKKGTHFRKELQEEFDEYVIKLINSKDDVDLELAKEIVSMGVYEFKIIETYENITDYEIKKIEDSYIYKYSKGYNQEMNS